MLTRYENQICPFDREILHTDRFTFSVLTRIMEGPCRLTLTDGARVVICHSAHPYPVWVWLPDDATEDELELVWQTLKTEFGVTGYRFNLKYALADYLIRRASEEGYTLRIGMNMFTYECPATVPRTKRPTAPCAWLPRRIAILPPPLSRPSIVRRVIWSPPSNRHTKRRMTISQTAPSFCGVTGQGSPLLCVPTSSRVR